MVEVQGGSLWIIVPYWVTLWASSQSIILTKTFALAHMNEYEWMSEYSLYMKQDPNNGCLQTTNNKAKAASAAHWEVHLS